MDTVASNHVLITKKGAVSIINQMRKAVMADSTVMTITLVEDFLLEYSDKEGNKMMTAMLCEMIIEPGGMYLSAVGRLVKKKLDDWNSNKAICLRHWTRKEPLCLT